MPSFSPYDWNESIQQRNEYIEDRLKEGSPVVALTYEGGLLLVSLRQTQRKVYEIYDRLMMSAVGNHSDVEQIRMAAIDSAHTEGFSRSPDDVTIQRLVSFRISPAIKRIYSDSFAQPVVYRGIFAELGKTPDRDTLLTLSYDGEFTTSPGSAVIAGSAYAEDRMKEHITEAVQSGLPTLKDALSTGIYAWGVGKKHLQDADRADADDPNRGEGHSDVVAFVSEALGKGWIVEAGVLERNVPREGKFRMVTEAEIAAATAAFRG